MCKLCNNSTKPANIKYDNKVTSSVILIFREVVKQYTGETPCSRATALYRESLSNNVRTYNVDEYIVRYLFRNYSTKKERQKLSILRMIIDKNKSIKSSYFLYEISSIGDTIKKKTLRSTGVSVYVVHSQLYPTKTFKTLSEAQEYVKLERQKLPTKLPRKDGTTRTLVEPYISSSLSHKTGLLRYRTSYTLPTGVKTMKTFHTLEEAQQFKQEVLNGNHGKHNANIA